MIFFNNNNKEEEQQQKMMIFRQGDILITKVNNIAGKKQEEAYSVIPNSKTVALGELTGHHHTFSEQSQVLLYKDKKSLSSAQQQQEEPTLIEVKSGVAELVHQEHNTILLPKGTYKVTREMEYNPFLGQLTRTAD